MGVALGVWSVKMTSTRSIRRSTRLSDGEDPPPPSKRGKPAPCPGAGGCELTSDARLSDEGVQASQLAQQPFNVWYGQEEQDSSVVNSLEASKAMGGSPVLVLTARGGPETNPRAILPTGQGTTVAVLDSGINESHTAFSRHSIDDVYTISQYSKNFVGSESIQDTHGHGTQCAGLLCGSPNTILLQDGTETVPFQGIAPNAKVMACKVVRDGTEMADIEAVCEAIDHVREFNQRCDEEEALSAKVNVISLSFGMSSFHHKLTSKIQEALNDNIIVVCAASNSGKKTRQPITYPARLGHVLCIGACTSNGKPADLSPFGRELDFLAYGDTIWAPTVGSNNTYCVVSGTSYAAPLVAGVVCQVIEDLKRLSELVVLDSGVPLWMYMHNVWCMRELLKKMAVVEGKHSEKSGFGILNPREYFERCDNEKLRIIENILDITITT